MRRWAAEGRGGPGDVNEERWTRQGEHSPFPEGGSRPYHDIMVGQRRIVIRYLLIALSLVRWGESVQW